MSTVGRKKKSNLVRVSYRFDGELEERMRQHCEDNGLIMSRFIETAIQEKLDREEKK